MSDSEIRAELIQQTAEFRYSVRCKGLRDLLLERGHDATACVQLTCDPGDDVSIDLILDDGTLVRLNYREHYRTRQAIKIVGWETLDIDDPETVLGKKLASNNDSVFDDEVRDYFHQNIADTDKPLPPLEWGDRIWHSFETPPD